MLWIREQQDAPSLNYVLNNVNSKRARQHKTHNLHQLMHLPKESLK